MNLRRVKVVMMNKIPQHGQAPCDWNQLTQKARENAAFFAQNHVISQTLDQGQKKFGLLACKIIRKDAGLYWPRSFSKYDKRNFFGNSCK